MERETVIWHGRGLRVFVLCSLYRQEAVVVGVVYFGTRTFSPDMGCVGSKGRTLFTTWCTILGVLLFPTSIQNFIR